MSNISGCSMHLLNGMKIEPTGYNLQVGDVPELTAANNDAFRTQIRAALQAEHNRIDLDLSLTAMLDSTGIGSLLSLNKLMLHRGGHLRIVHPSNVVIRTLQLTRLDHLLEVLK